MIKLTELFGDQGKPFPQDSPNEFAYLDFKKWAYKHRGQYKKDIQAVGDDVSKKWEVTTRWWLEWAKRKAPQWSVITDTQKFGRDLAIMMKNDDLIFSKEAWKKNNKITNLKNEGRIGFRVADYNDEAIDAIENFAKAGETLNQQIKSKTFERDNP